MRLCESSKGFLLFYYYSIQKFLCQSVRWLFDIFLFPLLDISNRWNIIFTILGRKGYRLALLASQLKTIREPTLSARNAELRKPGAVVIRLARVRSRTGKRIRFCLRKSLFRRSPRPIRNRPCRREQGAAHRRQLTKKGRIPS